MSGNPLINIGRVNIAGNIIGPLYARFTYNPSKPLEVDIPITFYILGQDNVTSSQSQQFSNFRIRRIAPTQTTLEDLNIPKHSKMFRIDTNDIFETWEIYGEVSDWL